MATRQGNLVKHPDGTMMATWAALTGDTDDVGTPVVFDHCQPLSVQAVGTWGSDGSLSLQCSNDGVTYTIALDDAGTPAAVTFTAAGIKNIGSKAKFWRAASTEGETGVTTYTLHLFAVRNQ